MHDLNTFIYVPNKSRFVTSLNLFLKAGDNILNVAKHISLVLMVVQCSTDSVSYILVETNSSEKKQAKCSDYASCLKYQYSH